MHNACSAYGVGTSAGGRFCRRGRKGYTPGHGRAYSLHRGKGNRRSGDTDTGVKAMADKAASAGDAHAKESSIAVAAAAAAIAGAALTGNIVLLAVA